MVSYKIYTILMLFIIRVYCDYADHFYVVRHRDFFGQLLANLNCNGRSRSWLVPRE